MLGADARGEIVITSRRAVTLLDPASFDVEDAYQHHADLGGAVLLAEHNCVVLQTSIVMGDGLTVVRWQ